MWDNLEDCISQLAGTIVRHNGVAVTVNGVSRGEDGFICSISRLSDGHESRTKIKFLDLSPVKLGYVNGLGTSRYLCRTSNRRWKHGLDSSNTREVSGGETFAVRGFTGLRRGIATAVSGKYPSLASCREALAEGLSEKMAFSRLFAIDNQFLHYRGDRVGKVDGEDIRLAPSSHYLQELLDEEIRHAG